MSEKIYAWMLKLYPAHFRQEYEASAMQLFRDRLRAERGVFRRLRFWLDVIADLAVSLPREHWRARMIWIKSLVGLLVYAALVAVILWLRTPSDVRALILLVAMPALVFRSAVIHVGSPAE